MRKAARILGALTLAALLAFAFTPLPNAWLARQVPGAVPVASDAIVVLGCGVDKDGQLGEVSILRLVEGVRLYHAGLAPVLVLSGPLPEGGARSEGEARAQLARELKVPAVAILVMDAPHTTREEAQAARAMLQSRGAQSVLLVTSRAHCPRSAALFARAGFVVHPVPVEDQSLRANAPEGRLAITRTLLQETLARIYYGARGEL